MDRHSKIHRHLLNKANHTGVPKQGRTDRKSLLVLLFTVCVDQERKHTWVAAHDTDHSVDRQVYPLDHQAFTSGR